MSINVLIDAIYNDDILCTCCIYVQIYFYIGENSLGFIFDFLLVFSLMTRFDFCDRVLCWYQLLSVVWR